MYATVTNIIVSRAKFHINMRAHELFGLKQDILILSLLMAQTVYCLSDREMQENVLCAGWTNDYLLTYLPC
jgi:hypothetical protein